MGSLCVFSIRKDRGTIDGHLSSSSAITTPASLYNYVISAGCMRDFPTSFSTIDCFIMFPTLNL